MPSYQPMIVRLRGSEGNLDALRAYAFEKPGPLGSAPEQSDPPKRTIVPSKWVDRGRLEGWITVEGEQVVTRSAGPESAPWSKTHTFVHLDYVILKAEGGDLRYKVMANPDKYPEKKAGEAGFGGEVKHVYDLKLEAE